MVRKRIKPLKQLVLENKQALLKDQNEIDRLEKKIEKKHSNLISKELNFRRLK
jgi:hypothetical protein